MLHAGGLGGRRSQQLQRGWQQLCRAVLHQGLRCLCPVHSLHLPAQLLASTGSRCCCRWPRGLCCDPCCALRCRGCCAAGTQQLLQQAACHRRGQLPSGQALARQLRQRLELAGDVPGRARCMRLQLLQGGLGRRAQPLARCCRAPASCGLEGGRAGGHQLRRQRPGALPGDDRRGRLHHLWARQRPCCVGRCCWLARSRAGPPPAARGHPAARSSAPLRPAHPPAAPCGCPAAAAARCPGTAAAPDASRLRGGQQGAAWSDRIGWRACCPGRHLGPARSAHRRTWRAQRVEGCGDGNQAPGPILRASRRRLCHPWRG
jgi:hypothetical protein